MTTRVIRIELDTGTLERQLSGIGGQLGRVERNTGQVSRGFRTATRVAAGFIAAIGIRELIRYADTMTNLESKLKLVTDNTEELNVIQAELFMLAQETSGAFESTVSLYQRAAIATQDLNVTQRELIDLTRVVNQTIQLSGATAAEAASSTLQFAQALASGELRGDELRSVLEGNTVLARSLAEGLEADAEVLALFDSALPDDQINITIGLLRQLGEEGELSSERIIKALLEVAPDIAATFDENVPLTFGRGLQQLDNAFGLLIGQVNDAGDVTGSLASLLSLTAQIIAEDLTPAIVEGFADAIEFIALTIARLELVVAGLDIFGERASLAIAEAREEAGFFDDALLRAADRSRELNQTIDDLPGLLEPLARLFASPFLVAGDVARALEDDTRDVIEAQMELAEATTREGEILSEIAALRDRFAREQEERDARRIRNQERIDELLDKRDDPSRGIGTGVDTSGPTAEQREDAEDFLKALEDATGALRAQSDVAIDAADALTRYESALAIEESAGALRDEINAATEALILQREEFERAEELRENRADDTDFLDALQFEADLIGLTNEEREIEIALRELSADATDEQRRKVEELVKAIEAEAERLEELEEIERAAEEIAGNITDILFTGFEEGFDAARNAFADFLQDLAQQLIESAIQQLIVNLINSLGDSSGVGSFINTIAGRQAGGETQAGQPFIAGEAGPELVLSRDAGQVVPATETAAGFGGTTIINEVDPEGQLAVLETARGQQVLRNFIQGDLDFIQRVLGQK